MDLPALSYPIDGTPTPGETVPVAPGVHWVRMPLPFALDHINLWLLEDEADGVPGWTLVDTGFCLPEVRAAWDSILAAIAARGPVLRIVVTHCHPDHLGLAAWLAARLEVKVWMSLGEYLTACAWHAAVPTYNVGAMVALFRRHGLPESRCNALLARGNAYRPGVPELPASFVRLTDGQRLTVAGREWRTIVGHGHSPEHMSLYCDELRVLLSGDMLLPRISTNVAATAINPEVDAVGQFEDSLARFLPLPADTLVLPAHGRPFRGVHARVAQLKDHHAERCAALAAACAAPKSAGELLDTLFPRALDTHQVMFAMGEAIAHLNHLEQAGRLRRVADGPVIRFVRPDHT